MENETTDCHKLEINNYKETHTKPKYEEHDMNKKTPSQKSKSLLLGASIALTLSIPAFGQKQGLAPPGVNDDCMGISDCARVNSNSLQRAPKIICDKNPRDPGCVTWSLVAQKSTNGRKYQVWYDSKSDLMWGDNLDSTYSYHEAITVDSAYNVIEEKACESGEGQRANAGIKSKKFGLATIEEYERAEKHGIREVLTMRGSGGYEYDMSASVYCNGTCFVAMFNGSNGNTYHGYLYHGGSVRCVGR